MPTTKKTTTTSREVKPEGNSTEVGSFNAGETPIQPNPDHAKQLLESYQAELKEKMDKRYKELVELFNKEVNIATRYELKLRIDELQNTYKDLFM